VSRSGANDDLAVDWSAAVGCECHCVIAGFGRDERRGFDLRLELKSAPSNVMAIFQPSVARPFSILKNFELEPATTIATKLKKPGPDLDGLPDYGRFGYDVLPGCHEQLPSAEAQADDDHGRHEGLQFELEAEGHWLIITDSMRSQS